IELRERGKAVALEYEELPRGRHEDEFYRRVFHPVASDKNPFEELGIGLSDIDVFWSFPWYEQVPSQLEIFSRYAKQGAIFLSGRDYGITKELELVKRLGLRKTEWSNNKIEGATYRKQGRLAVRQA
ncbi:MAG: hypothetical protein HY513_02610, partial [Candidatus Aenigmarchaeota archaeon]|nr:hypothetical protein [Candidatus Aenigmarchaeota archaeon]